MDTKILRERISSALSVDYRGKATEVSPCFRSDDVVYTGPPANAIERVAVEVEALLRDESEKTKRLVEAAKTAISWMDNPDGNCVSIPKVVMQRLESALAPFAGLADGGTIPPGKEPLIGEEVHGEPASLFTEAPSRPVTRRELGFVAGQIDILKFQVGQLMEKQKELESRVKKCETIKPAGDKVYSNPELSDLNPPASGLSPEKQCEHLWGVSDVGRPGVCVHCGATKVPEEPPSPPETPNPILNQIALLEAVGNRVKDCQTISEVNALLDETISVFKNCMDGKS